jgi:hypothetical protein
MSRKADTEKKEKEAAAAAISSIEAKAQQRFEADQAAAQEAAGKWVWMPDSQYYYNAKHRWVGARVCALFSSQRSPGVCARHSAFSTVRQSMACISTGPCLTYFHRLIMLLLPLCAACCAVPCCRWYYDPKTQWYYGGEPVAWTQKPGLPSASLFGVAPHEGGPEPQQQPAAAAAGGGGSGRVSVQEAAAAAAAATGQKVVVKKTVMQLPSHPQSAIGGHQMPTAGRIGGAKGVGTSDSSGDAAAKVGVVACLLGGITVGSPA